MKIRNILLGICAAAALTGCNKEDDLTPSNMDRNWLVVEDDPHANEIDRQRYRIFKETGIPVYFNDTVGSEERYSPWGSYTYYEVLQVYYTPGVDTPPKKDNYYVLSSSESDMKTALDYLEAEVLPSVPETVAIPSLLLVDSLYGSFGTKVHKGLNTIVVSGLPNFAEKTDDEKKAWKGATLTGMILSELVNLNTEWLEENFYALTYAVNPTNAPKYMYTGQYEVYVYKALQNLPLEPEEQTFTVCGFLGANINYKYDEGYQERMKVIPTKEQDVMMYCEAILSLTEEEFMEQYGKNETIKAKYYVMRGKLEEYGFTFE